MFSKCLPIHGTGFLVGVRSGAKLTKSRYVYIWSDIPSVIYTQNDTPSVIYTQSDIPSVIYTQSDIPSVIYTQCDLYLE